MPRDPGQSITRDLGGDRAVTGPEAFLAVLAEWLESRHENWLIKVSREGERDAGKGAGALRATARDLPLRWTLPALQDEDPTRVEADGASPTGLAA
jgi:hypothetical protein